MAPPAQSYALSASRNFPQWLTSIGSSVAFSTYQAAQLFTVGVNSDGTLSASATSFERCMGIAVLPDRRSFYLGTQSQSVRLDEVVGARRGADDWNVLFGPHQTWVTGDIDIHDIAVARGDVPIFVSTRYSCLATLSSGFSFKPLWMPTFVTRLAPEDRCHLNGVALDGGAARYATLIAPSDVADGWRDRKADAGMVWDIAAGRPLAQGLSMPHSPRLSNGRLWLLNSGSGDLGFIETTGGPFRPVAFCPGYARGLSIVGRYAVVGLSLPRADRTFQGLALEQSLKSRGAEPRCGLHVIDLETSDTVAWLRLEEVNEIFDVSVLPGVRNPRLIGFGTDEIQHTIAVDLSEWPKP
ncbi:MAG TPA: TIGR03032 family protein [Micropepsaceae bacterium]|nr:TIGR03032 family protein [Micropepsaceae bacterium]